VERTYTTSGRGLRWYEFIWRWRELLENQNERFFAASFWNSGENGKVIRVGYVS
jgi:hypothetical protein